LAIEPVAESMDNLCHDSCDFLVSIGDNFYQRGVRDIYDERWKNVFENVYGNTSERKNLKMLDFWQILGNHDYYQNATAQIMYSDQMETSFKLPWFWYTLFIDKGQDCGFLIRTC